MSEARETLRRTPNPKYFQITLDKLRAFSTITPKQQQLLLDMIDRLKLTYDFESFIGNATYSDFGYTHRQNYHKDKKALELKGFILTDRRKYFVRLDAIMYTSKRNYDHILKQVGAKFDPFNGFKGSNIPEPPK